MTCRFIKYDGCTAIMCGHDNSHKCDSKGHVITELSDGFIGNIAQIIHNYKLLPNYCEQDVFDVLFERGIFITMQSTSCSIC